MVKHFHIRSHVLRENLLEIDRASQHVEGALGHDGHIATVDKTL
jgi:hypothetical protein